MARRKVYLSVDFDYFCYEDPDWDWSHGEGNPVYFDLVWYTRSWCHEATSLEKHAVPHPRDFWSTLQRLGFRFDECRTFSVADSHMWAAHDFLAACPGKVDIVNFDAHHDMGYADWRSLKRDWIDKCRVDCSNWLVVLLHQLKMLSASIVYPQWKGERELEHRVPWASSKSIARRVRHGTYNEDYVRSLAGDVVGVFIAKSSAWVPPWHDQAFTDLVTVGAELVKCPLDTPYLANEGRNPVQPRSFDMSKANAQVELVNEMVKKWKGGA